jgi:hypothetical protein
MLSLSSGCGTSPDGEPRVDGDADTDTDSAPDSDTETDTDTESGTGSDTGSDTGTGSQAPASCDESCAEAAACGYLAQDECDFQFCCHPEHLQRDDFRDVYLACLAQAAESCFEPALLILDCMSAGYAGLEASPTAEDYVAGCEAMAGCADPDAANCGLVVQFRDEVIEGMFTCLEAPSCDEYRSCLWDTTRCEHCGQC